MRALVLLAIAGVLACVQTGSVGSDTGRRDDGIDPSADDDASDDTSTDAGADRYEACKAIDTTGEPFPASCTPSPADSQCMQCIKLVCCSELLSCPSYQACTCRIDCVEASGSPEVCDDACGEPSGGCDLSGCGAIECEQLCVD